MSDDDGRMIEALLCAQNMSSLGAEKIVDALKHLEAGIDKLL